MPEQANELVYARQVENIAPSNKAVKKAGSTIRKFSREEATEEQLERAIAILIEFRAAFSEPLDEVNSSLRELVSTVQDDTDVTQRLKKSATILGKLTREPNLDLSRMQDIGGCRIVSASFAGLKEIESKIRTVWGESIHHENDYISEPRESGYRGIHIIVSCFERPIEIQLRTQIMHDWAMLVEAFSSTSNINLKQDGNHVIQNFMKAMSKVDGHFEGLAVLEDIDAQLDTVSRLRTEVLQYLSNLQG